MYKILDREANEHVTFETYADACIFKGVNPKAAYKVKRNTKDRPKVFVSAMLHQAAQNGLTASYVREWLSLNKLAA